MRDCHGYERVKVDEQEEEEREGKEREVVNLINFPAAQVGKIEFKGRELVEKGQMGEMGKRWLRFHGT